MAGTERAGTAGHGPGGCLLPRSDGAGSGLTIGLVQWPELLGELVAHGGASGQAAPSGRSTGPGNRWRAAAAPAQALVTSGGSGGSRIGATHSGCQTRVCITILCWRKLGAARVPRRAHNGRAPAPNQRLRGLLPSRGVASCWPRQKIKKAVTFRSSATQRATGTRMQFGPQLPSQPILAIGASSTAQRRDRGHSCHCCHLPGPPCAPGGACVVISCSAMQGMRSSRASWRSCRLVTWPRQSSAAGGGELHVLASLVLAASHGGLVHCHPGRRLELSFSHCLWRRHAEAAAAALEAAARAAGALGRQLPRLTAAHAAALEHGSGNPGIWKETYLRARVSRSCCCSAAAAAIPQPASQPSPTTAAAAPSVAPYAASSPPPAVVPLPGSGLQPAPGTGPPGSHLCHQLLLGPGRPAGQRVHGRHGPGLAPAARSLAAAARGGEAAAGTAGAAATAGAGGGSHTSRSD